jgi:homoserine O-succinyltransferase/O-acetyltransferase
MIRLRAALLDLNNNVANRGVGYIRQMLEQYGIAYEVFDVRHACQIPNADFDLYISSGGPGSPFDMDGVWDKQYFALIETLFRHNADPMQENKKYVFFICHSFQLACMHFKVGNISQRRAKSFGTFPVNKTEIGTHEPYFEGLPDPFWIADFRDWQVTDADEAMMARRGFEVLALEKERPHVDLPRALMAVRFSPYMMGTQFHPEADADGMMSYFQQDDRRRQIIEDWGIEKYLAMLADLDDDQKIELTHRSILPHFLRDAIQAHTLAEV